jgi:alkaline phosphatase
MIVVTADHSHTMTILGYPKRGTDIRGVTGNAAKDELPEPILSYANGQGIALLLSVLT